MTFLAPMVCLDSESVRRIREENKLTQLYVAKVVGVTPDTISRWENNRYPTVKRENALRLAEALEVDVEAILQREEDAERGVAESPVRAFPRRPVVLCLVSLLVLAAASFVIWFQSRQALPSSSQLSAQRWLPHFAAPGSLVPIRVHIESRDDAGGFILRERFPVGWQMIEAYPPAASLDNEQGIARWIVRPGEQLLLVSYLLRVGKAAVPGTPTLFSGEMVVGPDERSRPVTVQGGERIEVAPFHWADFNGDLQVDDTEMLSASETFTLMKEVHLDWTALEKIWDAGGYRWDETLKMFVPVKTFASPPALPDR